MRVEARMRWDRVRDAVKRGCERGMPEAAGRLAERSRLAVPVLTGALRDSCSVSAEGLTGCVSYAAPYAVIVHEDMTRHHAHGGAKYLENAAADAALAREMAGVLAAQVRKEM